MCNTYWNCRNLTGSPVCGDKVTNMSNTYCLCFNLTGSPVCGDKVTDMSNAYYYCNNITGNPACGHNVTYMSWTYYNCPNIYGNGYFYNVTNVYQCFYGRNTSRRLNIYTYIPTTFTNYTNSYSCVGAAITWTADSANNCWYNTTYNIYVYQLT